MAPHRGSGTKSRTPLTKERVLSAAMAIADQTGVESLTMRALARQLGVEAMSLYYHVANKDEILAGILDAVAAEIDLESTTTDWKTITRHRAMSARAAFSRHPWAGRLWDSGGDPGPARLRYMDAALGTFRTSGFSPVMAHHAFHAVENHIVGYSLRDRSFPYSAEELPDVAAEFLGRLPNDEYPHLVEHVLVHLEHRSSDKSDFEMGLDLILDGVERIRNAE